MPAVHPAVGSDILAELQYTLLVVRFSSQIQFVNKSGHSATTFAARNALIPLGMHMQHPFFLYAVFCCGLRSAVIELEH